MEITLTTWERIMLSSLIGRIKGDVALIRAAGKLLDIIELSSDEAHEIGLREEAGVGIVWSDTLREWPIVIEDAKLVKIMKDCVATHDGWEARDRLRVIALADKIGLQ